MESLIVEELACAKIYPDDHNRNDDQPNTSLCNKKS